jgi:hypothetical protein
MTLGLFTAKLGGWDMTQIRWHRDKRSISQYNHTSVGSEGAEIHEWWSLARKPRVSRTITSVFLLPQKSHSCGFIFILCHKNYRKTTFNFGIPHSKFADGATTSRRPVQQYAWRHWGSPMTLTQQRKSVLHICCIWYFYTMPDTTARSPYSTGQIVFSFLWNISSWW